MPALLPNLDRRLEMIHRNNDQCNSHLPLVLVVVLASKIVEHGTARPIINIRRVSEKRRRRFHQWLTILETG
jgi:hypothetical protein